MEATTCPTATEALRAAATWLACDHELRDWTWRGAVLELQAPDFPPVGTRITAVEEFDGWMVVARLPIPEGKLEASEALLQAGIGLSLLWEVGRRSPGKPVAVCANGEELHWPEGARPAGVLAWGPDGPAAKIMTEDHAEALFQYQMGQLRAIKKAVDEEDLGAAEAFDEENPGGPPWVSEDGLDPLDLGGREHAIMDGFVVDPS